METIDTAGAVYTVSKKRNVLIGVLIWNVAGTLAAWLAAPSMDLMSAISIFHAVGNTVATLVWCHIDARERNVILGPGFRLLTILLGPLTLLYYLPRSRGIKRGLIALCWATGFILLGLIVVTISNLLLALISDPFGIFIES